MGSSFASCWLLLASVDTRWTSLDLTLTLQISACHQPPMKKTTGQSASIHWFKMWSPGHAIASRRCEVPAGIKERMRSFACAHNYASILEFVGHGRSRHAIHLKYKPCKRRLRVELPETRAACFHAQGRAAMTKCSIGRSATRIVCEAKE